MGWEFYFPLITGLINTLGIRAILLSASHTPTRIHSAAVNHNSMLTWPQSCVHKYDSDCHRLSVWRRFIQQSKRNRAHFDTMKGTHTTTSSNSNPQFSISRFALIFFFYLNLWCISKTLEIWCQHFHVHCLILVKKKKKKNSSAASDKLDESSVVYTSNCFIPAACKGAACQRKICLFYFNFHSSWQQMWAVG